MSQLSVEQLHAVADAYTTLRAVYDIYKSTERDVLALTAGESMGLLTAAFPQIAELEEAISAEPRP